VEAVDSAVGSKEIESHRMISLQDRIGEQDNNLLMHYLTRLRAQRRLSICDIV
jgi:hypothetical protein